MPDHHAQIELAKTSEPRCRPTDRIPHPRPLYFEISVGHENLSNTIAHVDNVTYVRWLDRVAEKAGDELGHSRSALAERDRMWFVARHEIDYLAETFAGDRVLAATWIHDARKTTCRRDILMWRKDREEIRVIAQARTTWAWIDLERRRPCRMPQDLIERLDPLHREDDEPHRETGS